jgi:hypothetical protein
MKHNSFLRLKQSTQSLMVLVLLTIAMCGTVLADSIAVEDPNFSLLKGNSVTRKLGTSTGLSQGRMEMLAYWNHMIGPVPGPLPVKLKIELIKPNGDVVESETAYSTSDANPNATPRFKLVYVATQCVSGQWKIRVTNNDVHDVRVSNIRVNFTPDVSSNVDIEGSLISLNKGTSVTKMVGNAAGPNSTGLRQGRFEVTANWQHAIGPVPGPLPVKLTFELINPSGEVVATQSAFSSNDVNPNATPRLKLILNNPKFVSGQWKLRISNNSEHDTMNIDPKIKFTPACTN